MAINWSKLTEEEKKAMLAQGSPAPARERQVYRSQNGQLVKQTGPGASASSPVSPAAAVSPVKPKATAQPQTVLRGGRQYMPTNRTTRIYAPDESGVLRGVWDENAQKRLEQLVNKGSARNPLNNTQSLHTLSDEEKGELERLLSEYTAFKQKMSPKEQELTKIKDDIGKYYRQQTAGYTFDPLTAQEEREKAALIAQRDALEKELGPLLLSGSERVASGAESILQSMGGSIPYLVETTKQTLEDNELMRQNTEYAAYEEQSAKLSAAITAAMDIGDFETAQKYQDMLTAMNAQWDKLRSPTPDDGYGAKIMQEAQDAREAATYGLSSTGKFLGDTAISVGQSVTNLTASGGNPAVMAALYGTQAAAGKAKELSDRDINSAEALVRGITSGAIEIATESFSIGTLLDAIKKGGKNVVLQMLKQAGAEASEEAVSYVLNFAADKAAKDPEAVFTVEELLMSALGGLVSGGFMGGPSAVVGNARQNNRHQELDSALQQRLVDAGTVEALSSPLTEQTTEPAAAAYGDFTDYLTRELIAAQGRSEAATEALSQDVVSAAAAENASQLAARPPTTGKTDADYIAEALIGKESMTYKRATTKRTQAESTWVSGQDFDEYMETGNRHKAFTQKYTYLTEYGDPIIKGKEDAKRFVDKVVRVDEKGQKTGIAVFGKVGDAFSKAVRKKSRGAVNIEGYYLELDANHLDHAVKAHKNDAFPVQKEDLYGLPESILNYDEVLDVQIGRKGTRIILGKKVNGYSIITELVSEGRKSLFPVSVFKAPSLQAYKENHKGNSISNRIQEANADFSTSPNTSKNVPQSVAYETMLAQTVDDVKQTPQVDADLPNSVGAAAHDPGSYSALLNEYGALPEGENPARTIDVPAKTSPNEKVTLAARTLMEADVPDSFVQELQDSITRGEFSYFEQQNQASMDAAEEKIRGIGYQGALEEWDRVTNSGRYREGMSKKERLDAAKARGSVTSNDLALATRLMHEAADAGDAKLALRLAAEIAAESHNAAQLLQATRLIKKMSPAGQLYYLQITADKLMNDCKLKYGSKMGDVVIDEQLADALLKAQTQEEIDAAAEAIKKNIGEQIPPTWLDKWNQWRYLAMLGNSRTHIRNIVGNAAFVPARTLKNLIGTGIERAAGSKLKTKTKAVLTKADTALRDFAREDYGYMQDVALGDKKYEGAATARDVMKYQKVFKFKPIEAARKANSRALEVEDMWFNKPIYVSSMAQYMKANALTPEFLLSGTTEAQKALASARDYAVSEAQKGTYRDASKLADKISKLASANLGADILVNGVLPFRKTPINIFKRGVEYSPIGLAKSLTYDMYRLKSGRIEAHQLIDNISAGLSGTAITALGMFLASLGWITGGDDENDKQQAFNELQGGQSYSIVIGDTLYSIDWMAPTSLPLFVGVELYDLFFGESKDEADETALSKILGSFSKITEPLYNLSMLQGVNSLIETASYSKDAPIAELGGSIVSSYVSQAVPTVGGQAARILDDKRRDNYVTDAARGVDKDLEVWFNKQKAKVPFASKTTQPYIDAWGREESTGSLAERIFTNLVSPGYLSTKGQTEVDRIIQEVFDETGKSSVLPSSAKKSAGELKKGGESYHLSAEQYTEFARVRGQGAYSTFEDLFADELFKSLNAAQKANVIGDVYSYANAVAKGAVDVDQPDDWTAKAIELADAGVSPANYLLYRQEVSSGGKSPTQNDALKALSTDFDNMSLTEKALVFELTDARWNSNPFRDAMKLQEHGISPDVYLDFRMNANMNFDNYINQKEAQAYLNTRYGLTDAQRAEMYAALNPTWKTNPYR